MRRALRKNGAVFSWFLIIVACFLAHAGCDTIDLNTDEGIKKALTRKEKLNEAMKEIKSLSSDRARLATFGPELAALYVDGSNFDREVLGYLTAIADIKYKDAYLKAAKSEDSKQLLQAASVISTLKIEEAVPDLIQAYDKARDHDLRRAIMEVGLSVPSKDMAKLAHELLRDKGPDDVPIANLRLACRVLDFQVMPEAAPVLIKAVFYADAVGRNIAEDCSAAVLALGRPVIPDLLAAFKLEDEDLNRFISRNQDRMTPESVVLAAATMLGKLRAIEGREALLTWLADPTPIRPPAALAMKSHADPAWMEWAALIGQTTQEVIFSLNDIGVEGDENAKKVLLDIYRWVEPYPTKYQRPIDLTGMNMIEISARVNAARVLAENGFLDDETLKGLLNVLKDPSFNDDRKLRPAARAALAQDLVTYLAITSRPGWTESVWTFFDEMAKNELAEKPDAKIKYDLEPSRQRIADMKSTYELADDCQDSAACFLNSLDDLSPENNYRRIKAVYEIGRSGRHDYFDIVLKGYEHFDAFGLIFATDALARLGLPEDITKVENEIERLSQSRDAQYFMLLRNYLNPLRATLRAKGE